MSEQVQIAQVQRCISCDLWFTAISIFHYHLRENVYLKQSTQYTELGSIIEHKTKSQDKCKYFWIAQLLLYKLVHNKPLRRESIEVDYNEIEFKNALNFIHDIPLHLLQELLACYSATDIEGQNVNIQSKFSASCLTFLRNNLVKNPIITSTIINEFCTGLYANPSLSRSLQNLYDSVLQELIQLLIPHENESLAFNSKQVLLFKNKMSFNDKNLGILLCILSRMKQIEPKKTELLTWLWPILSNTDNIKNIQLALYSRKDITFLDEWYSFIDELCARTRSATTLEDAIQISNVIFVLENSSVVALDEVEIVQRIIRQRSHWLLEILDICYTLIVNNTREEVATILSYNPLKYFWIVLLFKFINDCPDEDNSKRTRIDSILTYDTLKFLLKNCDFNSYNERVLHRLHTVLETRMKIIEWVLNFKETYSPKKTIEKDVSVKRMLCLLENSTLLSFLKTVTNIHNIEPDEIKKLLKLSEEPEDAFQAYSSMVAALKAILLCGSYSKTYEEVKKYLLDMESYLSSLFPLSVRLEIIENIFSLLFLRHDDFCQDNLSLTKHNTGFICNKYAIRELLHCLENSIVHVGIEKGKLKSNFSMEELQSLNERTATLTKMLADAKWRLELYTSPTFIKNINVPENLRDESHFDVITMDKVDYTQRNLDNAVFYKNEGGSDSDDRKIRSDSSSETEFLYDNHKWWKQMKNVTSVTDNSEKDATQQRAFVNFMLSSKESLIAQFLWKNEYTKAEEVVRVFNLENTGLDGEIRFSKALQHFKQDLWKFINCTETVDVSKGSPRSSTLETIRFVAQEGMHSSRFTSQLEMFLASQETYMRSSRTNTTNSNKLLTFSALDLALTTSCTYQITQNLCDVAAKYLKLCKLLENTVHSHFFLKIVQLLQENRTKCSMTDLLCDVRIPLSTKEWKEKNDFWTVLTDTYKEFKESQKRNIPEEKNKDSNEFLELRILQKVISLCSNDKNYLQNVQLHLQNLYSIIPDPLKVITASNMLSLPLYSYFSYHLFDRNVEPDKLEPIAQKLRVNLVYSILTSACPKLPSLYSNKKESNMKREYSSCIILNENLTTSEFKSQKIGPKSPNECVIEILSELLETLQSLSLGQFTLNCSHLKDLSKHPHIQSILKKTVCLTTLDLSELSVGDETLTFFLNVWNLMFLHTMLLIWADDPPFNDLKHAISLMSVAYTIGDLGLVTLAALRSKLLGGAALNFELFTPVEELNEPAWQDLDLAQDPRIIFAIANEFNESPQIRVFEAHALSKNLNDAANDYLNHYTEKHHCADDTDNLQKETKVVLPHLVQEYQNLLHLCKTANGANHKENLFSLEDYFKTENENIVIQYSTSHYSYEILLKYSKHSALSVRKYQSDEHQRQKVAVQANRLIKRNLLQYLEGHNWILSYIVQKVQNKDPTILDNNCNNSRHVACLERFLNSIWIDKLACFFGDNKTLAGIHEIVPADKLWTKFEVALEHKEWESSLEIINSLPDNYLTRISEVRYFKDKILNRLISENDELSNVEILLVYLYQIRDINVLAQTILHNIKNWQVYVCEYVLIHALHHVHSNKLPSHCKLQMQEILRRVMIFRKMLPYCANKSNITWYDVVYCTEKIDPHEIVQSLINADKFELCLEWLECQTFILDAQSYVTQELLIGLLKSEEQDFKQALKLLQSLPTIQSVKICKSVLKRLVSIKALYFIVNYLLEHSKAAESIKYRKALIGIDILKKLKDAERSLYAHLIRDPLLMLEQLLMNCKFETIQKILNVIQGKLQDVGISITEFDKIIRFYTKKALDFRVSFQRDGMDSKSKSIQQLSPEIESNDFVMPTSVPKKEEWVPNDKARECSCCRNVIFSMFNRRHHCRRCGRVVCAICSQHRMQVPGYPSSVSVRVCDDCKRQTAIQIHTIQGGISTPSSEALDYWRLTKDEIHNESIREEFSFEYAPSISLCLAILNLHSDHKAYTSFLLDRCDEMKRLLYPVNDGKANPEVDHTVIIKMIKSLLVAAKVKCAKLGFNTGLAHCDRFLSQIDLIMTLVQSDCLTLIPTDDLDEHALRKLRDLLTEKEQWTLALDVSTKSGLDTQGVWAAWGKACLKVGYFEQAREKFHHCLDKILYEDVDDWVLLPYPKEFAYKRVKETEEKRSVSESESSSQKKNECLRNRPLKDPPLLTEILQILDSLNVNSYYMYLWGQKSTNVPEILSTLNTLKAISQGQVTLKNLRSTEENPYYQESLYYLLSYGSYNSILEFFLKHEEFEKCLNYVLENNLEPELFFNAVYMYCLKTGSVDKLQEAMKIKDSSLLAWKKYLLFACHSLERKQCLHILYQLQLFMKDCVRASMTCIRFYTKEADSYIDLCTRTHLLVDAQKHLESELHVVSFGKKRRKSTTSCHSSHESLTMEMEPSEIDRHINTISRQMEIAKFLANAEKEGRAPNEFLNFFPDVESDNEYCRLPTLFGNQQEKTHLAVLAILCGRDVEEGFGIAFRIMQDYNLPAQKVYSLAGHVLALKNNVTAIEQLIKCCRSSGAPNTHIICDHVLTHCVKLMLDRSYNDSGCILNNQIDVLVRLITDTELKISAYIDSKQLKAAYLLAVKHSRVQDIRRILKEADRLGQPAIKAICMKWLQQT